jgi:hypothetical protein
VQKSLTGERSQIESRGVWFGMIVAVCVSRYTVKHSVLHVVSININRLAGLKSEDTDGNKILKQ